jgi:hypothetical protein
MLRLAPVTAVLLLISTQGGVVRAQEQPDLKTSLQACLNNAMTTGNFDKARMGDRGTLVVHCSDQPAQQMYTNLAKGARRTKSRFSQPRQRRRAEVPAIDVLYGEGEGGR